MVTSMIEEKAPVMKPLPPVVRVSVFNVMQSSFLTVCVNIPHRAIDQCDKYFNFICICNVDLFISFCYCVRV